MSWTQKKLEELYQEINRRLKTDPEFAEKLRKDSRKTLEELAGQPLPEGFSLKFVEKDDNYGQTYVLPDFAGEEIDISDLDDISGGKNGRYSSSGNQSCQIKKGHNAVSVLGIVTACAAAVSFTACPADACGAAACPADAGCGAKACGGKACAGKVGCGGDACGSEACGGAAGCAAKACGGQGCGAATGCAAEACGGDACGAYGACSAKACAGEACASNAACMNHACGGDACGGHGGCFGKACGGEACGGYGGCAAKGCGRDACAAFVGCLAEGHIKESCAAHAMHEHEEEHTNACQGVFEMSENGSFLGCEAYDPIADGVDPSALESRDAFAEYLFGDGQFDGDGGQ